MTSALAPAIKRPEDLLLGPIAVLALSGVTTLRLHQNTFHDVFTEALKVFQEAAGEFAELASRYHRDIVSGTYDELEHALIAAERSKYIGMPNPTYSRLQIKLTPRAALRLLEKWPPEQRSVIEKAAESLRRSVER
jgi:hypothetical protein